ncbi:hypothetical protein EKK58_07435 [Candidatus Dependentiae bacterium]|nr:MAG: hypothetical protein EKK58_07435 [Candidatus Dependentiae bacterium]
MTKEQVLEFLKSEDGKAVLEELTEEAVSGLKTKNAELLTKNKKLKEDKEAAEAKNTELEDELETAKNSKSKENVTDIEKRIEKKFEKQLKDATDKNDAYSKQINTLVVENGLTEALAKNNIAKQHIPAVKALIKSNAKIEISSDGDETSATIEGKAINDYVKEWSLGDTGKHYVAAPDNAGGGSKGSNSNANGGTDTSKLSPKEKMNQGRKKLT